jgi:hypothetical protein
MPTRKPRLTKWLAGIAFICLATQNARANNFTFEPPIYSPGNIIGQNNRATGYSSNGTANVVDNLMLGAPLAEEQSINVTSDTGIMAVCNSFDAIFQDGANISWRQMVTVDGTGEGSGFSCPVMPRVPVEALEIRTRKQVPKRLLGFGSIKEILKQ